MAENRFLDEREAYRILAEGEYGFLSLVTPEGGPYGHPAQLCLASGGAVHLFPLREKRAEARLHQGAPGGLLYGGGAGEGDPRAVQHPL